MNDAERGGVLEGLLAAFDAHDLDAILASKGSRTSTTATTSTGPAGSTLCRGGC